MSKMGMELDRRLDENKYEMYEALRESTNVLLVLSGLMQTREGKMAMKSMISQNKQVIAKVDGKG